MNTQNQSKSPTGTGDIELYPHQINALYRMSKMEQEGKGGVLAFEPGLGKTITVIAYLKYMKEQVQYDEEGRPIKPKSDLVVVPMSVIKHWRCEIDRLYANDKKPRVLVYYGNKRNPNEIRKRWDFIITSHDIFKNMRDGVYEINKYFERIVLDEAHVIKNGCKANPPAIAKTAFEFTRRSKYRWCITGTPFNNSVMDLASLAKFIGTKGYTSPKDWKDGAIDVNGWREKYIIIERKDGLLKKPVHHDVLVTPTPKETALIEALRDVTGKQFEKWMLAEKEDKIKQQGTLLGLITKMRQASDSYHIIDHKYRETSVNKLYNKSAKVQKTIEIINDKLYGNNPDPCKAIVVFSQFTKYLELLEKVIEDRLPKADIYMFTGKTSKIERDSIVEDFTQCHRHRILLISLFSGGVGLNFNPCSTVILSEPWYNPFIEQQAEDRVHRLGQTNTVNVYRITMENSIEKWIQGIKMSKIQKAVDVGIVDGVPKKGMGGISSTFKMEDLFNLFNEYVCFKKDGELVNPKTADESGSGKRKQKEMDTQEFTNTMNEWFSEGSWEIGKLEDPNSNKEYFGGGCIKMSTTLKDLINFGNINNMTYMKKIINIGGNAYDNANIDADISIMPGRGNKVQIKYKIDGPRGTVVGTSKLRHKDWARINMYLKGWYEDTQTVNT